LSPSFLAHDSYGYRAFEAKVLACAHEVHRRIDQRIYAKLRARVSADDIMQEVFTQTFAAYPHVPTEDDQLKRWMTKVGKTRLIDAIRFHTRAMRHVDRVKQLGTTSYVRQVHTIVSAHRSPSSVDAAREAAELLHRALAEMPERHRAVIQLHHLDGCSIEVVADRLQTSTEAVRALLRRGRMRLRAVLRSRGAHLDHV
jgi:RNA polymerase sigma-70 factor (ECF subfamily)